MAMALVALMVRIGIAFWLVVLVGAGDMVRII